MVTTNDFSLFESMWSFKDHGKSWQEIQNNTAPSYGPRLIHTKIGTNWRMMEIQAAIGILQLNKVEEWSARRNKIAAEIGNVCNMYSALRVPEVPKHLKHAYYRFYVFIKDEFLAFGWTRNRLIEEARAKGIPCIQGSSPEIYLEPAFQSLKIGPATRLPVAQELGESSIAFLVHPTISNEELDKILFALNELLSVASL
jgi:dTDP-4-amino-4,6-dideoxygalactose transaminase